MITKEEWLEWKKRWEAFNRWEAKQVASETPPKDRMRACPCCGFLTLPRGYAGSYELCPVCWWEDDQVQYDDPSYEGGANAPSLTQARANFAEFGACERNALPHVRPPKHEEYP